MVGSTLHEFDMVQIANEGAIISLLGIKHTDEITDKYRKDLFGRKLLFNHTTATQAIFLSTYVVAHSMRAAGGEVYLYSYKNSRHSRHTDDLSYIMGIHAFEPDANEKVLAEIYPKLFMDFIKTGKPRQDWTLSRRLTIHDIDCHVR
ncbi:hypothetical protein OSTOST_14478 [Ostertagia ostertagi]